MGRLKKYCIKSINFGEVGNPARTLVESYIKKHGKAGLSKLMRKLALVYLSQSPEFDDYKIEMLKFRRKDIGMKIYFLAEEKRKVEEKLEESGVEPEDYLH